MDGYCVVARNGTLSQIGSRRRVAAGGAGALLLLSDPAAGRRNHRHGSMRKRKR